jgi:gas vesicle protein
MHRFRIVVAGGIVAAMMLATLQIASAGATGRSTQSSSAFCATAQQLESEIQSLDDIDLESLSVRSIKATYRTYVDLVKQLQKETPKELKDEFKRLRRLYQRGVDGKLTLGEFPKAISRAGDDLSTIFAYLEDECGIAFETPTTT